MLNSWQQRQLRANENPKEGNLVRLIEERDKRGYFDVAQVTEMIEGSGGVIGSAKAQRNNRKYKNPVVKLAPVLKKHERGFSIGKQGR